MPINAQTTKRRRELTLRALRGENRERLAEEYGVSVDTVYRSMREAKRRVAGELAYWSEVAKLVRLTPAARDGG